MVARIRDSDDVITFTVIDERSDERSVQGRSYLFKISHDPKFGGFGFCLWFDNEGHFVQQVSIGSPADKAG